MTRRQLIDFLMTSTIAGSLRAQTKSAPFDRVAALMSQYDLAILRMDLKAFTLTRSVAGKFASSDFSGLLSVSPDAKAVAWIPKSSLLFGAEGEPNPVVRLRDELGNVRSVGYEGSFALSIGLSATGLIYLVVGQGRARPRLIAVTGQPNPRYDLTDMVSGLDLSQIENLRSSSSGNRVAVGWRESFVIIDAASRQIIFQGKGRFPRLSPNGESLAFVTTDRRLAVVTIGDRKQRVLQAGWEAYGMGAWDPEGKWLLVGATTVLGSSRKLMVVDTLNGDFVELWSLGDDGGDRSLWIGKHLLQPV
jgi:hypothetical protein